MLLITKNDVLFSQGASSVCCQQQLCNFLGEVNKWSLFLVYVEESNVRPDPYLVIWIMARAALTQPHPLPHPALLSRYFPGTRVCECVFVWVTMSLCLLTMKNIRLRRVQATYSCRECVCSVLHFISFHFQRLRTFFFFHRIDFAQLNRRHF